MSYRIGLCDSSFLYFTNFKAFGDKMTVEKVGYNTFNLIVSPDQLKILETLSTVDAIYIQPKSGGGVYIENCPLLH
ncbi:hypothetical protein POTG_02273 [Paenibacillus sp. oral taxon 786 str. D14]|uniref:hypothetical protein n=1 Tax=Paenibacillus sp. 3LSP TaxID=2800795 RepID=UPI0001AFDA81|nr:hypothetical protein [Paenibacillus sp. 3LSP]EES73173.1 hypothetical protein POTG_02273 [Paenibacillus sp. oral taxon 786 str. D14]